MTLYLLSEVNSKTLHLLSEVKCMTLYLLSEVKCMRLYVHNAVPRLSIYQRGSGVAVQMVLLAYSEDNRLSDLIGI